MLPQVGTCMYTPTSSVYLLEFQCLMLLTAFMIVYLNLVILVGAQISLEALVFTLSYSAVSFFFKIRFHAQTLEFSVPFS